MWTTLGLVLEVDASSREPREDERDMGKRKVSGTRREELKELKSHAFLKNYTENNCFYEKPFLSDIKQRRFL